MYQNIATTSLMNYLKLKQYVYKIILISKIQNNTFNINTFIISKPPSWLDNNLILPILLSSHWE